MRSLPFHALRLAALVLAAVFLLLHPAGEQGAAYARAPDMPAPIGCAEDSPHGDCGIARTGSSPRGCCVPAGSFHFCCAGLHAAAAASAAPACESAGHTVFAPVALRRAQHIPPCPTRPPLA